MGKHLFRLGQLKPQDVAEAGTRVRATKSNFPALEGMSFYKLSINAGGIREPHWHANADELGYCIKGQVLVSIYGNHNARSSFLVGPGETFYIPSGALHAIENAGPETAELIVVFSHEEPEDFSLSGTFGMFSDAVLGNTWGVSAAVFKELKRSTRGSFMAMRQGEPHIPVQARYASRHRYNLEGAFPLVGNDGGAARVARQDVWPILQRQAVYSLKLASQGMREPHWHPETAELGYVHEGTGRMSILSPSGDVDTYEMHPGDIYFIPKAYPHHIENLTPALHLLIFFDQAMPQDIGFTGSVKSNSDEMLGAVFGCPSEFFARLPTYYEDAFIVGRVNPLDK